MLKTTDAADKTANQTVRLDLGTKDGVKSMRIGFTHQRLTAHGGLAAWTCFITERGLREQLRAVLPHAPAVAEVLGIEASPSQSMLSRFFARCGRSAGEALSGLHRWAVQDLPERAAGCTLDLDSFSLIHEDGHQEGVRVGYTRKGLKPCHRPIVAALAEVPLFAHFWLRPGNTACVSGASTFLGDALAPVPASVRVTLVRADSGFCTRGMIAELESRRLHYLMTAALRAPVRTLYRHDDTAWTPPGVPGLEVQEVAHEEGRLIVLSQRVAERPHADGKKLLEMPGYKFQALRTNLPATVTGLEVWHR